MFQNLIQLRKELHTHPELSGFEENTSARIKEELQACNPDELTEGLGGVGVMARFSSGNDPSGPTILFRAELDAIAVNEETGLDYGSVNNGVMHGCGHDGHMTILTGLARHLGENPPENVHVLLLFQPAEETGEGALKVMEDERFKALEINHAFALHNLPGFRENTVVIKTGVFAAASAGLEITFRGKSSHAAYPEQGINPSQDLADFILKTDQILKPFRQSHPCNKAVNTFIELGKPAYGISPGTGRVGYTLRSPSDGELVKAVEMVRSNAEQMNDSFEGAVAHRLVEPFAATVNSMEGVSRVKNAAASIGFQIENLKESFPWSEDFGEFRKKCPITLFGLGAGEKSFPLHSENYDFNDKLIPAGVNLFRTIIESFTK